VGTLDLRQQRGPDAATRTCSSPGTPAAAPRRAANASPRPDGRRNSRSATGTTSRQQRGARRRNGCSPQNSVNIRGWLEGDHQYAYDGARLNIASMDRFAEQLGQLAALAPKTADSPLRGVFVATRRNDKTFHWLVRNRQVVAVPGDPYQDHPGT
jgi:hypothetical protein